MTIKVWRFIVWGDEIPDKTIFNCHLMSQISHIQKYLAMHIQPSINSVTGKSSAALLCSSRGSEWFSIKICEKNSHAQLFIERVENNLNFILLLCSRVLLFLKKYFFVFIFKWFIRIENSFILSFMQSLIAQRLKELGWMIWIQMNLKNWCDRIIDGLSLSLSVWCWSVL